MLGFETAWEASRRGQPITLFSKYGSIVQIIALFSNYSTAFDVLHCFRPITVFSDYCTVFKLLFLIESVYTKGCGAVDAFILSIQKSQLNPQNNIAESF